MSTDNMRIYNQSRAVPPEAQKSFNNGRFSGTDINPMWRIKKLTELYGPCGIGWYTDVLNERSERLTEDTVIAVVDLNLYVKDGGEWSKPIYGTGGNTLVSKSRNGLMVSDEGYKMAYTDALSVACKALGIGADVYYGNDRTKYTATQKSYEPMQKVEKPRPLIEMATQDQIDYIADHASPEQFESCMTAYGMDCERMPYNIAVKLVDKLKGANA